MRAEQAGTRMTSSFRSSVWLIDGLIDHAANINEIITGLQTSTWKHSLTSFLFQFNLSGRREEREEQSRAGTKTTPVAQPAILSSLTTNYCL